jgi:RNA polymerase sigma-70 factor (ECF subfamily)
MTSDAAALPALERRPADDEPVTVAAAPDVVPPSLVAADGPLPPERVPLLERLFLRRLQGGDPKAFRELVKRHEDRVFGLSLRMLGDAHEAEDVAQEVFVAVHRHLPRFRGDCRLSTWIFRVTRNHCLNRLKSLARRETACEPDLASHEGEGLPGSMPAAVRPDKALLGAEERARVQSALQRLTTEHRLLVVLRDIEGMSYEEIGRIADLPPGTVKSRLHRARAHLAELLSKAGMAPDGARGRF